MRVWGPLQSKADQSASNIATVQLCLYSSIIYIVSEYRKLFLYYPFYFCSSQGKKKKKKRKAAGGKGKENQDRWRRSGS